MSFDLHRVLSTAFGTSTLLLTTLARTQPAPTEVAPEQPVQVQPVQAQPAPAASSATPAPSPETPPPAPALARADDAPQVLFQSDNGLSLSGYGGLDVGYTRVAGKDAALLCAGGALLLSRTFSIGLMGCGVPKRIPGEAYSTVVHEPGDRLEFGYGGVVAGYYFFPKKIYNLSLSAMVGGGAASIVNRSGVSLRDDDNAVHVKSVDPVFVAEPRLTGYLNLTRWARFGAFVGYRFVGGVDMQNLSSSDMSGPVAGGTLQFGWF